MDWHIAAPVLGLFLLAGIATPLIFSKQSPCRSGREGVAHDLAAKGLEPARPPAHGPSTDSKALTGTPAASRALVRLRNCLAQADRSPFLTSQEVEMERLVRGLAPEDLPRAWALRGGLKSWSLQDKFGAALMDHWAAMDGPAALAAAGAVADKLERQRLLDRGTSVWAGKDPTAAAAWVKSFYCEAERGSKLMLVFYGCGSQNPAGARLLWQQLPQGILRDDAVRTFVDALAQQDLSAALACLDSINSAYVRKDARDSVLLQCARTDPAAALAWAQSQPRLQDRDEMARVIVAGVAHQDPGQAAELLKSLGTTALVRARDEVSELVGQWAGSDLSAASAWVKQLPEGKLRDLALAGLVPAWVAQEPSRAAAFARDLPEGPVQAKLLSEVACVWSRHDSKAVLGWLDTLPEGSARNAALSGLADGLASLKPEQAAGFVASLPVGDLQTKVALKVVNLWSMTDPPSAAAWVAAFPPGQTRDRAIAQIMNEWRKTDRQAAEAWRQRITPPPESKKEPWPP
jgi:hypothetical protein